MNVSTRLCAGASVIENASAAASEVAAGLGASNLTAAAEDFVGAATDQARTVGGAAKSVFTGFWDGVYGLLN